MNENKFSPRAEEALRLSQEAAGELGHGYVGTEHLLLGLIREEEGMAHDVLVENGLTDEMIVEIIKTSVGAGLPGSNPAQGLTPRAKRAVEIASICWRACCGKATTWPCGFSVLPVWMPSTCIRP